MYLYHLVKAQVHQTLTNPQLVLQGQNKLYSSFSIIVIRFNLKTTMCEGITIIPFNTDEMGFLPLTLRNLSLVCRYSIGCQKLY
jgi:hypothetical protein